MAIRFSAFLAASVALTSCAGDVVQPPPKALPYLGIPLPPSVRAYHAYRTGWTHEMVQIRFDMEPSDLPALEAKLPCRLGPVETGRSAIAHVASNDRDWYTPESARKHRGCSYHHGIQYADFLVDVEDPARYTVYGEIELD
jgi:hypothetical protein